MKKPNAIIVGGTGQFGLSLSQQLLRNKYNVYITTRSLAKARKKYNQSKILLKKLNILKKEQIKKILLKVKPRVIFFFGGAKFSWKIILFKKRNFFKQFQWM